ncbi:MAG TPA: hypothetical protein VFW62_08940, partial [bacterium]|nr:hypothetical protein [bacterium]
MDPRIIILALLVSFIVSSDTPARNPRQIRKDSENPDPDPNTLETPAIPWPEPANAPPDGGIFADGGSYTAAVSPQEALRRLSAGVCDRLVPCQEGSQVQPAVECEGIIQETNQMNRFFGLLARNGLRPTLTESMRAVTVDSAALDRCLEGLSQVTCEDVAEDRRAERELDEEFGPAPESLEDLDPFYFRVIQTHSAPELASCREIFSFEPVECG